MAFALASTEDRPLGELNTTPLIDVMLVLLVMFILAIPVATHSTQVELPSEPAGPTPAVRPDRNQVVVTPASAILWNGGSVTQRQLYALLSQTTRMKPEPELQYQPDPQAPYDTAARVLTVIKAAQVTKFGFAGNDRFSEFDKAAAR